jgi:hypothetical protein
LTFLLKRAIVMARFLNIKNGESGAFGAVLKVRDEPIK